MPPHAPTWFDWLTVLALLLSPVLALTTQRLLDWIREKKQRRFGLYLTLMSLRATPLHPDHVKALNALDTVFDSGDKKDAKVRRAWEQVLNHVTTRMGDTDEEKIAWNTRLVDLRVDLYQAVGQAVGYDHSIEYIKGHIYLPTYYTDAEGDQLKIRAGFAKILTDDGLKVVVNQ